MTADKGELEQDDSGVTKIPPYVACDGVTCRDTFCSSGCSGQLELGNLGVTDENVLKLFSFLRFFALYVALASLGNQILVLVWGQRN